jgi:ATP-dependent DNA helicase RecG
MSKNTINPVDILASLSWGESEDLEFKSAKGGIPRDLWETYSAMANTQGGVILLGVQNNGTVSGISDTDKIKKQFWDTVNNRQKVSINLLQNGDIQVVTHPNGNLLAIRIRRADRRERPVYIGQNPLTGTYRRNSDGDYHCTEQEVRRMVADSAEDPADSCILEGFTLDDLDLTSLHQYRNRLASHNPSHPWLAEDDMGLLKKLNGWRICRKNRTEGLTVAGLLMFGRDETIREGVPQYFVDFRERLSLDPNVRWTDRLTQDGTWQGNLYQFYHRVIQRLSSDLKLSFELDKLMVRKGESVVHIAIREALVNSLIHADYQGQGGIIIEKYPDRFEFSNPGSLLISFDQILRGGISECRNKSLQQMFTFMGAAERAGSGIDKIRSGWNSQHWRLPIVREQMRPDRVMWTLPMLSIIPEESLDRLKLRFGAKFSKFNKQEVQALVTADIESYVDNARMRQITDLHAADITRLLQGLVAKEALCQDGHGRWTQYTLSPYSNSLHLASDSPHLASDSPHLGSDSLHLNLDSPHLGQNNENRDSLKDNQRKKLEEIAAPAHQSGALPRSQMKEIILSLCRDVWLTRLEISSLLNRNPDGIRDRFLTSLVDSGELELRYPDKPNRVDQAYRTARKLDIE